MTILRVKKKSKNFVVLDKTCYMDVKMSIGAKGLHIQLMRMPDNWQVNIQSLTNHNGNGRDSIKSALKELEEFGYITKVHKKDPKTSRFLNTEYLVHEISIINANNSHEHTTDGGSVENF
jgi:hypothetical protein